MNRRGILKAIFPALTVPFLGIRAKAKPAALFGNEFNYRGWRVWWTGWKGSQSSEVIAAQWCASRETPKPCHERHDWRLVVSNPGSWGVYWPGQTFDLSVNIGQAVTTSKTPKETLDSIQSEMRLAMAKLIDHISERPELLSCTGYRWPDDTVPVVNPEFGDHYRHCWHRFNPETIKALKEEEAREEAEREKYVFRFSKSFHETHEEYLKMAKLEASSPRARAMLSNIEAPFSGGKEIAPPIIFGGGS